MTKHIEEYYIKSRGTAIYPDIGNNYSYPLLGLIEECSEVDEKIETGDNSIGNIMKELGDVYWYLSSCCFELKINFLELIKSPIETKLKLSTEASKIAGYLKKIIRDDDGILVDEKKEKIILSLKKIVYIVNRYESEYRISKLDIMNTNLEKLFSRKSRGVLKGSGDNR
jgi:NTP pyrophosphatase (non-canonical NTP hydrolase)